MTSEFLLPNSLYRAACFENFEGIFGFVCSVNHLRGGGVMQVSHNASHPLAIPTRRQRESFEQNTSIKLKYFTLLPEATSMSRARGAISGAFCGQQGCGKRGIFFLCITLTETSLRAKQIVGTFSDLADSLSLGKTTTLNETNIENNSQP